MTPPGAQERAIVEAAMTRFAADRSLSIDQILAAAVAQAVQAEREALREAQFMLDAFKGQHTPEWWEGFHAQVMASYPSTALRVRPTEHQCDEQCGHPR